MRKDHGIIIEKPSMEDVSKDLGVKRRRMPNEDNTVKVGDLDEIESVFITFPR